MKRSILVVILLFAGIKASPQIGFGMGIHIPLNGGKAHQQGQNIESEVQKMKKDLALDSSQVVKVRGLLVERDRRTANHNPMSGKEYDERIQGILNADQYKKFAERRQQKSQQQSPANKDSNYKQQDQKKDLDDVYY